MESDLTDFAHADEEISSAARHASTTA